MRRALALALFLLPLAACSGCAKTVTDALKLPPPTSASGEYRREWVSMRDGVKLVTDVYLPEGEGPWPVILIRNPYNFIGGGFGPVAKLFSYYGYVGVHQVARGRADSEGEWNPFLNERNDGLDTLAWLKAQPWNDGNVGMFGASYLSMVQWAVADALPPEVKTLVPVVWGNDLRGVAYEGGVFKPEIVTAWAALMHDETLDYLNAANFHAAVRHRPQIEIDETYFGRRLPWLREWMSSVDGNAAMWRWPDTQRLSTMPTRVTVPMLMIGGWYDIFLASMIFDYGRLATRDESRLLIGPWTHLTGMDKAPDKPIPGAGDLAANFHLILNWFDHYLKGAPLETWGPVRTYAIGAGAWVDRPAFPPATRPSRLYLRALAAANACAGGRLLSTPPPAPESVGYAYDPNDPVPSRGGSGLLAFALPGWGGTPASMRNQAGLCERDDVLSFVSPPMREDTRLAGTIKVAFTAATDVDDTAFTAKLIEVAPDGFTVNMRDAITTLRYRNGATTATEYVPGQAVELVLEMAPIEWELKKGYALRVDLSSSNFPAFAVHTNYAGDWSTQTKVRTAHQTIASSPARPAYVELPVLPAPAR